MKLSPKYIFLLFFLFNAPLIFTQVSLPLSIKFDRIGLDHGLSQSAVNAIVQDKYGFMWFGTQDGLNRYNAYSVSVFKNNPEDSASISDNTIWSLLSISSGKLLIGTMLGGLNIYDYSTNSFTVYKNLKNDNSSISRDYITCMLEDSRGNIWIGTDDGGLNLFDPESGTFKRFMFDENDETTISSNTVWDITEDNNGNLWIATSRGLSRTSIKNNADYIDLKFIRYEPGKNSSGNNIHSICFDSKGNLWIGSRGGGLISFDPGTDLYKYYFHDPKIKNSISSNIIQSVWEDSRGIVWIASYDAGLMSYNEEKDNFTKHSSEALRSLYEDKSGILWIGTFGSGVKIFDQYKNYFAHYYDDPLNNYDMNGNVSLAIIEDRDGDLWVGTYGTGLNRFDKSRKNVTHYLHQPDNKNSLSNNKIITLCESSDGKIWIGTEGGGLNSFEKASGKFKNYVHNPDDPSSISSDEISALFEDRRGNLWVGTNRGTIDILEKGKVIKHFINETNDTSGLSGTSVTSIYQDKSGTIWVGTIRGGLHRYLPETDNFERCHGINPRLPVQKNNNVFCINEDEKGNIWFGTVGGGLNRYNPADKIFKSYTTKDGLSNDNVFGIHFDNSGNLWISTNNGLCKLNLSTEEFQNYDVRDGLQSNEFNQGAHFKSPSGEMFFGGMNGVNAFYPDRIKSNNFTPPVYITSFTIFDNVLPQSFFEGGKLELDYSENFFSFEFTALNYTSPEKNMYAYMLEGFDKDWHIVPASHRYGSYTNLDPGEYTLIVKGSNNDGLWSENSTTLILLIKPPFWMTWWFRSLIIIILLLSIGLTIRHYILKKVKERVRLIEQEVAVERERLRISRDMHDELGSRLTEIRWLSEMAQKDDSGKSSAKLMEISEASKNIINTFSDIVWSVNPQNDNIENLIEYIASYAMEYLKKFNIRCRLHFPDEFPVINVSSEVRHNIFMVIKEILNNAVKYSGTDEIHLSAATEEKYVVFSVTDYGKGFDRSSENGGGNGLINMKKRLEQINGICEIESVRGSGTTVKLKIPMNNIN